MKKIHFWSLLAGLLIGSLAFTACGGDEENDTTINHGGNDNTDEGTTTAGDFFYLGTTKPTAENYKVLPGVITSYKSIDDALETTISVAAGETLYMLCPTAWMTKT